jgi:peroxiredoxin
VGLRERALEIETAGGALAAISTDTPEESRALEGKLSDDGEQPLGFPLLCDPTKAAVKAWGLYDGDDQCGLPAVVILGRDRRVAWLQVSSTIYTRAKADDVIAALEKLRDPVIPPR